MVPATLIILTIFLLQVTGQLLLWLYWLQIKEYRFDRFWFFLKSSDGKRELVVPLIVIKFFFLSLGFVFNLPFFLYLIEIFLLSLYFFVLLLTRKLRRPVFTTRVIRILIITGLMVVITFLTFAYIWHFLFAGELLILVGPFVGTFITSFSVAATLKKEVAEAEVRIKKYKPVVLAITGSYGKTTTKDFITQLLSVKYKVLSTFKNQNTHFGIVRRINSALTKKHQILIVEVGAYKRGEIEQIAKILKPSIAVITGIEPQHLELFGSLENLKRAKFELIDSLRRGGSVFFNLSNFEVETLLNWARSKRADIKVVKYGVGSNKTFDAVSKIARIGENGTEFIFKSRSETKRINTNITSRRILENLTGAIAVARNFGVSWEDIEKTCQKLELPEGTLNVFKTKSGLVVIDDSYNATPHGFEAAIELLAQFPAKKRAVLTTGVIELGAKSDKIHCQLGKMMDTVSDFVLVRNREFVIPIGMGMKNVSKVRYINDQKEMVDFVNKELGEESALLIEGKLPQVVDYFKKV